MGVGGGFLLAIAVFYIVTHCIGCFFSVWGSKAARGAGFLFVLTLVVPASVGLSTLAYYGVQSAVALYVEAIDQVGKSGEDTSATEIPEALTEPKLDSGKMVLFTWKFGVWRRRSE